MSARTELARMRAKHAAAVEDLLAEHAHESDDLSDLPGPGERVGRLPGRVLVARCDNWIDGDEPGEGASCTGEIRFRWGMGQSDPCDVCGGRCGISVAAWLRVEP